MLDVLSIDNGGLLLPYFFTTDLLELRLVCREFLLAIRGYAWNDRASRVPGPLHLWHACFPRAVACNLTGNALIHSQNPDLHLLQLLPYIDLSHAGFLTSPVFAHLRFATTLILDECNQVFIPPLCSMQNL